MSTGLGALGRSSRTPVVLDDEGWSELTGLYDTVLPQILDIQAASDERRSRDQFIGATGAGPKRGREGFSGKDRSEVSLPGGNGENEPAFWGFYKPMQIRFSLDRGGDERRKAGRIVNARVRLWQRRR